MGADWNWVAVEVTDTGNSGEVKQAMDYEDSRMEYAALHDDILVFDGIEYDQARIEEALSSVTEYVTRVVLVRNYDTAGAMLGTYYESRDGQLEAVDRLHHDRMGGPATILFDYFSAKYGIHAAI